MREWLAEEKKLNDIVEIVLGVLATVGGISGIILAAIKLSVNMIAKRLEEKYVLRLNKELERYKSNLDNKIYISKTKFDTEFKIYRELSKAFFEMVKDISVLIPSGLTSVPADPEKKKKYDVEIYNEAMKSTVNAQDILNGNIPFISEEIYNAYTEILKLCKQQLNAFGRRWNRSYLSPNKEEFTTEEYNRTNVISQKFFETNNKIRRYIEKLDVLE